MLRTISIGTCVSVQGVFVKESADGKMTVKVDGKMYSGVPISRKN